MGDHDHAYKLLFAHPQMVRELLEFQSSVEPFMAVRVLTYVGLLYQDLIRAKKNECEGELPAILPIVLHNGSSRWRAAQELATLFRNVPDGLEQYSPQLRYLLIDEGSYDDGDLACRGNLVAMLFRLESCQYGRLVDRVSELLERLRTSASDSLRRAFVVWLERVVLARMPCEIRSEVARLWEKPTMLSENIDRWEIEWARGGAEKILTRLLHKRFGELPEGVQTSLSSADLNQLGLWSEQLLDVETLDELFPIAAPAAAQAPS